MAHIDLDDIVISNIVGAPDASQNSPALEHLARMHQEQFQQVKLARGQIDGTLVACDKTCDAIERDSLKREHVAKVLPLPPQHCPHPRHEFLKGKRLGHRIVRTDIQSGYAVLDIVSSRKHNDRSIVSLANMLRNGHAIQTRQHQVKNHYIGLLLGETL